MLHVRTDSKRYPHIHRPPIMSITYVGTSANRHNNNASTEPILKASASRYNDFQFKKYPFHGFFPVKAGSYEG